MSRNPGHPTHKPADRSRYLAADAPPEPDHLVQLYRLSAELYEVDGPRALGALLRRTLREALPRVGRIAILLRVTGDADAELQLVDGDDAGEPLEEFEPPRRAMELALSHRLGVLSRDVGGDARFAGSQSLAIEQINSMAVAPLGSPGELWGLLYLDTRLPDEALTEAELDFALAAGRHAGLALANLQLHRRNRQLMESLVRGLAATIDARDGLTFGHSARVARYSRGLARQMGLGAAQQEAIYFAGLLHDYGKIAIDDAVLRKPDRLTPDEFAHIREHARYTYDLLRRMSFPPEFGDLAFLAACHHERLDGAGYPFGLKGDQVPLGGQIIAVADVYDSLTRERHYRKPMPIPEVLEHLEEGRGPRFRGDVLDAFFQYHERVLAPRMQHG